MIKLIGDVNKLKGTAYFELLPGSFKNKHWNKESVFLDEENFGFIEPIIERCVEKYGHYSFVEVNRDKWERITSELLSMRNKVRQSKATDDLLGDIGFHFADTKERFEGRFDKNKKDLEKTIRDLVDWIRETLREHERISILGL
jgi:hypothetical protein